MGDRPTDFDVVVPQGPASPDGGMDILRVRPGKVTRGRFIPIQEGKPLVPGAEMVEIIPRPDTPIFDVRTVLEADEVATEHHGPPKVVSDAYRTGWETIFCRKTAMADEAN